MRFSAANFPTFPWLRRRLIVIALVVGNLALGLVVLEQNHTITAQRELIHQLNQDSLELNSVRMLQHIARKK